MIELSDAINSVHSSFLNIKNLDLYVKTKEFQKAWDVSSQEDRAIVLNYINNLDKDNVVDWTNRILGQNECLEEYCMRKLRNEARKLGVHYYAQKSRGQLIIEIRERLKYDKYVLGETWVRKLI